MAQMAKMSTKTEIKAPPAKIFDFFRYKTSQLHGLNPQLLKKYQVIEGKEGQAGSVKLYEYVLGKPMTAKVKVAAIDENEKSISYEFLEGEVLQMYPTFKVKVSACEGYVECSIEFEKANDSVPNPDAYANLACELVKGVDAYVLSN